jgi:hypothetical protein
MNDHYRSKSFNQYKYIGFHLSIVRAISFFKGPAQSPDLPLLLQEKRSGNEVHSASRVKKLPAPNGEGSGEGLSRVTHNDLVIFVHSL